MRLQKESRQFQEGVQDKKAQLFISLIHVQNVPAGLKTNEHENYDNYTKL